MTVSHGSASHTPSLAISTQAASGKGITLVSGTGLSHGPQSLSPIARAQHTPPGKARSGPFGNPPTTTCPSFPPASLTRRRSSSLSCRRCSLVRRIPACLGFAELAGLASTRKAAESPTFPIVSSPRVSLIRHTVTVVPAVCRSSACSSACNLTKVRSMACASALPLESP